MWEAIQKLWEVIQVPDNRDTLTWVGGGIAAVCGGIATVATGVWAVVKFRAKLKKAAEKKGGDTNITQSGQGLALGDKAIFNAPVTIAPNSGPSPEHIEKIQKPWADELAAQRIQFAALQSEYVALTKMLLEKNPAAGPGAQQAVGAAVGSIAQGAAEGDSRMQQALDLLKANKIAEASQLLRAFAEAKTARAEEETARAEEETARAAKDRKEAAIAYRNLGAIAGLADPKLPGNAGWQRDLSVSYDKVGGVQEAQGNLAGALKSYSDSLAIADRLAKADPGNAGWQRDLATSFGKLAAVHRQSGDRGKARDFLRQGQAIMARLTKLSPENATWKQDLAWFDGHIAELAKR
jgi:tetratricopeptide (TPR) repeat protein